VTLSAPREEHFRSVGVGYFCAVTPDQSSVRKGEAGKPSLLKRLKGGLSGPSGVYRNWCRHLRMRHDDSIAINMGIGPVELPTYADHGKAL